MEHLEDPFDSEISIDSCCSLYMHPWHFLCHEMCDLIRLNLPSWSGLSKEWNLMSTPKLSISYCCGVIYLVITQPSHFIITDYCLFDANLHFKMFSPNWICKKFFSVGPFSFQALSCSDDVHHRYFCKKYPNFTRCLINKCTTPHYQAFEGTLLCWTPIDY